MPTNRDVNQTVVLHTTIRSTCFDVIAGESTLFNHCKIEYETRPFNTYQWMKMESKRFCIFIQITYTILF